MAVDTNSRHCTNPRQHGDYQRHSQPLISLFTSRTSSVKIILRQLRLCKRGNRHSCYARLRIVDGNTVNNIIVYDHVFNVNNAIVNAAITILLFRRSTCRLQSSTWWNLKYRVSDDA